MEMAKLKVVLVSSEFFMWNRFGGFGAFTRKLAVELVKQGVEVELWLEHFCSVQPLPGKSTIIDGVTVKTMPRKREWHKCKTDADIIHSQCDPLDTYAVFRANPDTPKIVTVQDLRTKSERKRLWMDSPSIEWGTPSVRMWPLSFLTWHCARANAKRANIVAVQAHLLKKKVNSRQLFCNSKSSRGMLYRI